MAAHQPEPVAEDAPVVPAGDAVRHRPSVEQGRGAHGPWCTIETATGDGELAPQDPADDIQLDRDDGPMLDGVPLAALGPTEFPHPPEVRLVTFCARQLTPETPEEGDLHRL